MTRTQALFWLPVQRKESMSLAHRMQQRKDRGIDLETGDWVNSRERDEYAKLEAQLIRSDDEIERLQAIVGDSED